MLRWLYVKISVSVWYISDKSRKDKQTPYWKLGRADSQTRVSYTKIVEGEDRLPGQFSASSMLNTVFLVTTSYSVKSISWISIQLDLKTRLNTTRHKLCSPYCAACDNDDKNNEPSKESFFTKSYGGHKRTNL